MEPLAFDPPRDTSRLPYWREIRLVPDPVVDSLLVDVYVRTEDRVSGVQSWHWMRGRGTMAQVFETMCGHKGGDVLAICAFERIAAPPAEGR